jgi:hypothetical protein
VKTIGKPWENGGLPSGKLLHNELERSTMLLIRKLTISTGPFSIANCWFTRGYIYICIYNGKTYENE